MSYQKCVDLLNECSHLVHEWPGKNKTKFNFQREIYSYFLITALVERRVNIPLCAVGINRIKNQVMDLHCLFFVNTAGIFPFLSCSMADTALRQNYMQSWPWLCSRNVAAEISRSVFPFHMYIILGAGKKKKNDRRRISLFWPSVLTTKACDNYSTVYWGKNWVSVTWRQENIV